MMMIMTTIITKTKQSLHLLWTVIARGQAQQLSGRHNLHKRHGLVHDFLQRHLLLGIFQLHHHGNGAVRRRRRGRNAKGIQGLPIVVVVVAVVAMTSAAAILTHHVGIPHQDLLDDAVFHGDAVFAVVFRRSTRRRRRRGGVGALVVVVVVVRIIIVRHVAVVVGTILPSKAAGMTRQGGQGFVDTAQVRFGLQNHLSIVGMEQHAQAQVDGHEGMRDDEKIKDSLDQGRVAQIVGKPGNNPRQGKKGRQVHGEQVIVDGPIQQGQQGIDGQAEDGLEGSEIFSQIFAQVCLGELQQDGRRQLQTR